MSEDKKPWGRITVDDVTGEVAAIVKQRRGYVLDDDFSLDPGSLTGSTFHVVIDRDIVWRGIVVAEPQAGKYLCEIEQLEEGASAIQRLFTLDTMLGLGDDARRLLENAMGEVTAPVVHPALEWRFFDSIEESNRAFTEWTISKQSEKEV